MAQYDIMELIEKRDALNVITFVLHAFHKLNPSRSLSSWLELARCCTHQRARCQVHIASFYIFASSPHRYSASALHLTTAFQNILSHGSITPANSANAAGTSCYMLASVSTAASRHLRRRVHRQSTCARGSQWAFETRRCTSAVAQMPSCSRRRFKTTTHPSRFGK